MEVEWTLDTDLKPQLRLSGTNFRARDVEYSLRSTVRDHFKRRRLTKSDQGKVYEVTTAAAPPSRFLHNGDFTRFAEWRLSHRSRMDCVPLNGTHHFRGIDKRCRRCGHDNETLPYVLNHCKTHLSAVTRRRNAVLDRLAKALVLREGTTVQVNQTVPVRTTGFDLFLSSTGRRSPLQSSIWQPTSKIGLPHWRR
jgi:hypothetical protein